MPSRQPRALPRLFLVTDERMGDAVLFDALRRLPKGAGVVFRHYSLIPRGRRALYERVRSVCRRRRLLLLLAGAPTLAIAWRADGAHGHSHHRRTARELIRSVAVHDRAALIAARGMDLRFVSPVYPTRSHPDAGALGLVRLGLMISGERRRLVALGGVTVAKSRRVRRLGITRWAAIDGLSASGPR